MLSLTQYSYAYFTTGRCLNISHYTDVIIRTMASQITGISIVYLAVCLGANQRKHQSSASLAFVRGIQRSPVNSPHKGPVTRKMFPFDDVIMKHTYISVKSLPVFVMEIYIEVNIVLLMLRHWNETYNVNYGSYPFDLTVLLWESQFIWPMGY